MAESLTEINSLKKYELGDKPGADNLNANWVRIDKQLLNPATSNPSTYPVGGFLLRSDQKKLYENTGTHDVPVWTLRLDGSGGGGPSTPKAATFVVAASGGDYATVEAAVAAVPSSGADIYVREGTFAPAASIALPGDRDVRIRGAGAIGITKITIPSTGGGSPSPLFTVAGGATGEYDFSGFLATGDNTFQQSLINLDAAVDVSFADVEVIATRDIVVTSTTPEVSFTRCKITFTGGSTVTSFWRGSSGGTLIWNYVDASFTTPSDNGILGAPDWSVTDSYIGGGGPVTTSCFVGKVTIQGFRTDKIHLITQSPGGRIVNLQHIDGNLEIKNNRMTVVGSIFTLQALGGTQLAISGPGGAGGAVNVAISGCVFDGGGNSNICIDIEKVQGVAISGCSFVNYGSGFSTDCAIAVGATGGTNEVTVVGCTFGVGNPGQAVYEFDGLGTIRGKYDANMGFEGAHIASDSFSTVNGAALVKKTGSTTNSLAALFTHTNLSGLDGYGLIKNTGAKSLDVKETVTDGFGTTTSATNTVTSGSERALNLRANINTGRPPYVSYKVEVVSTLAGNPTTYDLKHTNFGVQTWV